MKLRIVMLGCDGSSDEEEILFSVVLLGLRASIPAIHSSVYHSTILNLWNKYIALMNPFGIHEGTGARLSAS